jgi:hypothetical protein
MDASPRTGEQDGVAAATLRHHGAEAEACDAAFAVEVASTMGA